MYRLKAQNVAGINTADIKIHILTSSSPIKAVKITIHNKTTVLNTTEKSKTSNLAWTLVASDVSCTSMNVQSFSRTARVRLSNLNPLRLKL